MAAITHVGGPTTLIEVGGWRILTDPTFDAPGRTYRFGWGTSSRKTAGPALAADEVRPVDAVLVSHDHHADNLDDAGRLLLAGAAVVTTVPGAARLANDARGLRAWQTTHLESPGRPTLTVTATPCRHGPFGTRPIVGEVVGFLVTWEGQRHGALWVSGDTVLYSGVREVAERAEVSAAVVHLGGVRFPVTGKLRYSMTGADAVDLCATLRPRTVVPVHYEGWSHFAQGRAALERELASPRMVGRIVWPTPGIPVDVEV
jgi:L-ascorbate metabolism protein UlaG (beta-lactamase superfamily)